LRTILPRERHTDVVGLFIAATVVGLLQYLRLRDRRLLPLLALFAFQAQALSREWWDVWKDVFQAAACAAGLLLLLMLSPRHPPAAKG
jgi:signal transduction histidine kinase